MKHRAPSGRLSYLLRTPLQHLFPILSQSITKRFLSIPNSNKIHNLLIRVGQSVIQTLCTERHHGMSSIATKSNLSIPMRPCYRFGPISDSVWRNISVVRKPEGGRSPGFGILRCGFFENMKAFFIRIRMLSIPSREETLELPILGMLERGDVHGCK